MKTWRAAIAALATASLFGTAAAAEKPSELRVGVTTFLSGPASVFGEPARVGAEMMVREINERGGIGGVPVRLIFVDEGAGGEHVVSEFRRLVEQENVDVMFASISSGNCNAVAPLAEDLGVLNFMWDCGTQRIFEEDDYRYVFRTQAHATPEMLATLLYLLKAKPDFQTIAVVNQDYAWGRDSWDIFSTALRALKPDVRVVAELFPRFGAPDYSTEVTRLAALRPDVILSTSWGGDLDTFIRQAAQRGLLQQSTFVLPLAESSLERLGRSLPPGHIIGARGDHYFLHPEFRDDPDFQGFMEAFRAETGAYPIYPVFHMSQAIAALEAAYLRAIEANGGAWPERSQVVDAMAGLTFQGLGRPVTIREDNQGLEAQLIGMTIHVDEFPFAVLDDMVIYDPRDITTPVGMNSIEWLRSLTPDFVDSVRIDRFSHAQ
ncbi:MAG: branched-chain amino acid ABC transporter substrate-binding protein [Geminicoccaceae bacterium]|nr:MAG: branched-chain amino acid ABC transporter substrate-binding protein [Geminicoccaceae bacterium]